MTLRSLHRKKSTARFPGGEGILPYTGYVGMCRFEILARSLIESSRLPWVFCLTIASYFGYSKKIRRSDHTSLAHFASIPPHNAGHENRPHLGLLSSLNVVRYLRDNHRVVTRENKTMPNRKSCTSRDVKSDLFQYRF